MQYINCKYKIYKCPNIANTSIVEMELDKYKRLLSITTTRDAAAAQDANSD